MLIGKDFIQKVRCRFALGLNKELLSRALLQNFSFGEECHLIGDFTGKAHLMSDKQHRSALIAEFRNQLENFGGHFRIKCRGRFVKE